MNRLLADIGTLNAQMLDMHYGDTSPSIEKVIEAVLHSKLYLKQAKTNLKTLQEKQKTMTEHLNLNNALKLTRCERVGLNNAPCSGPCSPRQRCKSTHIPCSLRSSIKQSKKDLKRQHADVLNLAEETVQEAKICLELARVLARGRLLEDSKNVEDENDLPPRKLPL